MADGKIDNDPGKGVMFKNRDKEEGDNRPDYKGSLKTPDGKTLEVALWKRESKNGVTYISLNIQTPWEERQGAKNDPPVAGQGAEKEPAATTTAEDIDEALGF